MAETYLKIIKINHNDPNPWIPNPGKVFVVEQKWKSGYERELIFQVSILDDDQTPSHYVPASCTELCNKDGSPIQQTTD